MSHRTHSITRHPLPCLPRLTLLAAAVLQALSPLSSLAQIVADPGAPRQQQPTVLRTPGGQPLVNIQTPGAAGVSRNTYRQFDVGPEGAVLNNSRTGAPTRIGGTVGANPWLARGEARVIVNEVNSHAPSLLRGPLEIAGRSAELIVANPAGIQVQGASFLNAQRVTLAAATPLWNGGDLLGLRTAGGLLRIDADPHGLGMDTRGASHTDILARAVQVNAAVWANRLRVVTGQNTVAPGSETEPGAVTPADPAAGPSTSPPPAFALDVSALGGLYANAITLVGTEAGLGVRNSGIVAARAEDGAGSLVITQSGQLLVRQGGRLIGPQVQIQADELINEDGAAIVATASDQQMDIRARRLTNRSGALIHSNADMALSATERLENRSATIEALGHLRITAGELLNANDLLTWHLLPDAPTDHLSYYTPGGEVDGSQVAWSVPGEGLFAGNGREQLLLKGSPWADPVWRQRYLHPDPLVLGRWVRTGGVKSESWRWVPDAFTYSRHDPIWAAMGMTAPTWDPPAPRAAPDTSGYDAPPGLDATPDWAAQAAPWLQLNERVQAMRQQVRGSLQGFDAFLSYRQSTQRAEVTTSAPARIASGGHLQMQVGRRAVNQDSEILAGGTLSLQAGELFHQATTVATPVQRSGTLYAWGVVGRDCDFTCDPVFGWISSPYAVQTSRSQALAALRQTGNLGTGTGTTLYQPAPDPQSPFLLQSDPLLGAGALTSSQRQLDAMGWSPNRELRRLGDAAWEQQRLREQVSRLSGQRFLSGFQSDEDQYRALLDAGVMAARTLPLRPGVALSAEQVRRLTTDIVWLVEQTVSIPDGQGGVRTTTALVPQLYLAPRHQDLAPGGLLAGGAASGASQIGGQQVVITTSGDTTNSGSLQARGTLLLQSQNLRNLGGQISADTVVALAQQDIENLGGQIAADSALLLQAGRDVRMASTTTEGSAQTDGPGLQTRYSLTEVDRQASVHVSGRNSSGAGLMVIQAGRDVQLQATAVRNDGSGPTQLTTGRDLDLSTTTTGSQIDAQWQSRRSRTSVQIDQTTEQGTSITTRGGLSLQAGQNVTLRGAELKSDADLRLGAGHTVLIDSAQSHYRIDYSSWHKSTSTLGSSQTTVHSTDERITQHASELTGANLAVSGQHIVAVGGQLQAQRQLSLQATGQTLLLASQDVLIHERTRQTRSRSVGLPSRSDSTEQALQIRSQATTLQASEQVRIGVGQRTELQGTRVQAPVINIARTRGLEPGNDSTPSGQLDLTLSIDTDAASQHSTSKTAGVWQSVAGSGFEQQTAQAAVLQGELRIDPQLQVNAQNVFGKPALTPELQALQQQLQSQPQVRWREVELAQRSWAYEQQGLTGLGAALVSLAVAWATGGMGTELLGSTSAAGAAGGTTTTLGGITLSTTTAAGATALTAAGAAVNAGFSALASMAAVSLINNGGDIGKTLRDLGSADAVKNLLASMAAAGALHHLGNTWTIDGKPLASINPQNASFTANLGKNLVQGVGSAVITSTLTGANLQDALGTALVGAVVGAAAAFGANAIGDMVSGGQLNAAGQALLHALVGCAAGAAGQGGQTGCAAGAAGAVVGELAAAWYDPDGTRPAADTLAFVRAVSGVAGALAGGSAQSVTTGALTGVNAAQNNRMLHPTEAQLIKREARRYAQQRFGTDKPTTDQIKAAEVELANTAQHLLDNNLGGAVPYFAQADAFLQQLKIEYQQQHGTLVLPGTAGSAGGAQQLFHADVTQMNMPWLNQGLADPAIAGLIVRTPIQPPRRGEKAQPDRDRLTGLPLDEQGRYEIRLTIDGKSYSPKFHPCGTTECLRAGGNLDRSDPDTKEYINALHQQIWKDIGTGATVGALIAPVGLTGAGLALVGTGATAAGIATSTDPLSDLRDETIKAIAEMGAVKFFENILQHPPAAAARAAALINLAGGWEAFTERFKEDLLGIQDGKK